ncbi:long-chain fatty acid--CoA ligase [Albimonas sp. CAU 1670]|uniref:class I adenylate-forming enzyme family protein n=1 Tax=Albimonas sp. CAU 1670 TaxID=3032599 RepID=UPI0023DA2716|nr:long-chain fatty acid--CoA ligase [Albimonas sp. CAU 1670]MDF2231297.1 long-chain fatty acid--CoA ligase [Albimonas sp. CAU 1670]
MSLVQMIRRNARCRSGALGLVHGPHAYLWPQVEDRVSGLAGALQGMGVGRGDRVSILADNSHRYVELIYACAWLGAVIVPLNHRLAEPELAAILEDAGASVLLADDAYLPVARRLAEGVAGLREVLRAGDGPGPAELADYEARLAAAPRIPPADVGMQDLAGIFYTGGTSGTPKGVMHTHANLWFMAFSYATMMEMTEDTVSLCSSPLFHVAATCALIPAFVVGGCVVVLPRFDAGEALAAIEAHGVTLANFVPSMFRMLLDHPSVGTTDLRTLRQLIYGAAPMAPALLDEILERFEGIRIHHAYGMTELTACITILPSKWNRPEHREAGRWRSAGQSVLSCDVAIHDPDGRTLPPGERGEIVARGPLVMAGYWNRPEQTAEALRGGWMHTGDVGWMDEDGFVYVIDRLKDMIISGGENVYASEVEAAMLSLPGVNMAAAIGVPHPKWGEAVHGVVVLDRGARLTEAEIIAHCRTRIAGYKIPRSVAFRETMPMSGVNKILKRELLRDYLAAREDQAMEA